MYLYCDLMGGCPVDCRLAPGETLGQVQRNFLRAGVVFQYSIGKNDVGHCNLQCCIDQHLII